jgi:hypothetical protein
MRPELAVLVKKQRGVFRRKQALAFYTRPEVEQRIRAGTWVIVRHGIYATAERYALASQDPWLKHLLMAAARRLVVRGDTVVSHESAAVFHRIELLDATPAEPSLTLHRPRGSGLSTAHGIYVASVPDIHRVTGVPVTTAARTVVDCARSLSYEAAFVTAESALQLGLDRALLSEALAWCRGWPGVVEARDLIALADEWSESPLESKHRLWFRAHGLPQPKQQRWIQRVNGGLIGRVDFIWPQYRTVCEADGRKKYVPGDPQPTVVESTDPLWQEKLREDNLRDVGLEVVRGYWKDGEDEGAALAERVRRAFARGLRATGEPAYRIIYADPMPGRPLSRAM